MIFGVLLGIMGGVFEVGKSSGCGLVESFVVHLVSMEVTLVVIWRPLDDLSVQKWSCEEK